MIPEVLINHDHHFRYPTIDKALAHELGREKLWAPAEPEAPKTFGDSETPMDE